MKTGRLIAAILLPLLLGGAGCKVQSDKPASTAPYLDQGWTQEQRQEFYHKSQGTRLIPLPWFLALTQKGGTEPFLADSNIAKFRFIPDAKHKFNEYGLPVGFAVTQTPSVDDPAKMVPWVGWTCAACHTGQISAKGEIVQIDGAPSMQHNAAFVRAMLEALGETVTDDKKLEAFAKTALGIPAPGPEQKEGLKKKVAELIDRITMKPAILEARTKCGDPAMKRKYADPAFTPTPNWGFGRLDAIGRASNTLFAPMHPCNLDSADSPVSIPKTWSAWKYNWVQWNAFVENPLGRNLAQAIALGADPGLKDPKARTVSLKALGWLEDQLQSLKPPRWEEVFGPVDSKLAGEGKTLYHQGRPDRPVKGGLCAHCHQPEPKILACDGKEEIPVVMVQIHEEQHGRQEAIGTDATTMLNYTERLKRPPPMPHPLSTLPNPFQPAIAMSAITSQAMAAGFAAENIPKPEQDRMQRCRGNAWWSKKEYKAPTHDGVWATAPYLHNGSVPNLYLVLSPKEERDRQAKVFCVGHDLTYDPANVGFVLTDQCPGPASSPDIFKFDTTLRNNGNMGHEFRKGEGCEKREGKEPEGGVLGCELSEHERRALVEYLKTL